MCDTSYKKQDAMIKSTFALQFFTLSFRNFELILAAAVRLYGLVNLAALCLESLTVQTQARYQQSIESLS